MPYIDDLSGCCGVQVVHGLHQNTRAILLDIAKKRFSFEEPCAFYIFTDRVRRKYGKELAKLINKLDIGPVTAIRPKKNPNSHNKIIIWTWDVDDKKFKSWWFKQDESNEPDGIFD